MLEEVKQPAPVKVKKDGSRKQFAQDNNNNSRVFMPKAKFEDDCKELKGYIFDCSDPR
jgi:hypothetical protein